MVDQETLNRRPSEAPTEKPPGGIDGILHRLVLLAELQAELLWNDVRTGLRRLLLTLMLVAAAIAGILCGALVAGIFIGELLVDLAGLHRSTAFFLATVIDAAVTIGLAVAAYYCLRSSVTVFRRSRDEWRRNMHWVKDALANARSAASQDGRKP
ncbi:MAG: phage holin family protein [Thermoguttaceae bacterium]